MEPLRVQRWQVSHREMPRHSIQLVFFCLLEENSASCEIRLCFISFKKDLHMAQIFKSLPMGLFSSCGACMLEYVCPANRMLCWLVSHFGYWSLLSPNLLIDFFSFFLSFSLFFLLCGLMQVRRSLFCMAFWEWLSSKGLGYGIYHH